MYMYFSFACKSGTTPRWIYIQFAGFDAANLISILELGCGVILFEIVEAVVFYFLFFGPHA